MTDPTWLTIHGRKVRLYRAGSGPVVVLVHGIAGDAGEWSSVMQRLSKDADVLAPDLPGHGESGRLRGDHSLGAYASWLRDVLEVAEVEQATFVGHSLGGGIVMQFAYQFPQYVERMVLVSSGGLGREVSRLIRAAGLPGAELVLQAAGGATRRLQPVLDRMPAPGGDYSQVVRRVAGLADPDRRAAFVGVVRAVTSPAGQRVSAADRLYLAAEVPTMIVWGERDTIIPVSHGRATAAAIADSRLVVLPESAHFPHLDDPQQLATLVSEFVGSTLPAVYDRASLRRRISGGQGAAADPTTPPVAPS